MAAFFFIPDKGRAVVAEVAGEGCHVVRGVREAEHMVADEVADGFVSELAVVISGCDDGELFDDVPGEVGCLDLLASNVIKTEAVEIGEQTGRVLAIKLAFNRNKDWQCVSTSNLWNDGGDHGANIG